MKTIIKVFALIISCSFIDSFFHVAAGDESVPDDDWTVVTCDGNLFLDYRNQRVIFFNNVLVKNPRGSLRADRLIIFFSPDGKKVERTKGEGNIRIRMEGKVGTGDRVVYYPQQKKAVLLGNAMVTSGVNTVRGGKITFFLDKKEMEVQEAPDLQYFPDQDYDVSF
ncbi:MAG: LptA/OstA family protein [Candidatus Euphemobacter frigidus]|nr:LptA/OstA family protein [Candidatus Euphemobacter frigidus]MDP8275189.1 LptA/OstA family protein [Candidatus Euphemobacter frigidus]